MKTALTNKQVHTLSQRQQESIRMLQMTAQEMDACLHELAMENPLLELQPPRERFDRPLKAGSLEYRGKGRDAESLEYLHPVGAHLSFRQTILAQIMAARVSERERAELKWLLEEMDGRGYLPADFENLKPFQGNPERFARAVERFQSFEPAGVGARSLSECLCIQLRRQGIGDPLPYAICREHLERLGKGYLNRIAEELGTGPERVEEARRLIAGLNPIPANGYAGRDEQVCVIPDLELDWVDGEPEVRLADQYLPRCGLDSYYLQLAGREDLTEEEQAYFQEKLNQARWVIRCVENRGKTLLTCAEAIVLAQRAFFEDGRSPLQSISMSELADRLGVHVSTVSRAVKGKHISCRFGCFPLSMFFRRECGENPGTTAETVTACIEALIDAEDPCAPLSDSRLAELLQQEGYTVSRRTVAKYRDAAHIKPAHARRRAEGADI